MEKQFDNLYGVKPVYSDNPASRRKQAFIEQEQARKQSEVPLRPPNIGFFEKLMYSKPSASKRPRVGYFCNMIPPEIIAAMGADAVRLDCGNNMAATIGEEIFAGEICPVAKASFGMFLQEDSLCATCDLLVVPSSCDAKRKMGEVLNDFKPTFTLNIPTEQNHKLYVKQTYLELKRFVNFLSDNLGTKLKAGSLIKEIEKGRRRSIVVRKLQDLRAKKPQVLSIRDLFLIIQSAFFRIVDLKNWLEETEKVIAFLGGSAPPRKSLRPRLVLTGAPMVWPNFKVLNLLEESGADIVADTLCTGAQAAFDPVVIDERGKKSLLRALANRYVYASICPCFISQTTRINRILELNDTYSTDGVINYSLRLCQLFDVENYRLGRTLKERRISYMNVRSDYSLEDTEQLRVRIEAFLETL